MVSTRYKRIDIAKGIGILFVVFGHNWIVAHGKGELFKVIYSFHVPLFFFLSGLFMAYDHTFRETIIKKSDSYLKPYCMTAIIAGLFIVFYEKKNPVNYLIRMAYGNGLTIPWKWVPLWFLPHIWAVSLFSYLCFTIANLGSRSAAFKILFLTSILSVGYMGMDVFMNVRLPGTNILLTGLPFNVDLILVTSLFFFLGSITKPHVMQLRFNWPTLITSLIAFSLMHIVSDSATELNMRRYDDLFISTGQALIGIYVILAISAVVEKHNVVSGILSTIGVSSLFIMNIHFIIQHEAFSYLNILSGGQYSIACAIASFGLAVFIPVLLFKAVCRSSTLSRLLLPMKYYAERRSVAGTSQ